MKLRTKGGCPLRPGNANPAKSKCFILYFYKTFSGKTEIRLFLKTQNLKTRRWEHKKCGEIFKSGREANKRISQLLNRWE